MYAFDRSTMIINCLVLRAYVHFIKMYFMILLHTIIFLIN